MLPCVWGLPVAAHTLVAAHGTAQKMSYHPPTFRAGTATCDAASDAPLLPVGIITGMLQPIVVVGRQIVFLQQGHVAQWSVSKARHISSIRPMYCC